MIEQQVAGRLRGRVPAQDEDAAQAELRGGGGGLPGVVGLRRANRDERVGFLLQRVGDQEFQLAGFVAAAREPVWSSRLMKMRGPSSVLKRGRGSSGVGR